VVDVAIDIVEASEVGQERVGLVLLSVPKAGFQELNCGLLIDFARKLDEFDHVVVNVVTTDESETDIVRGA
jgi:hypothetical protein